MTLWTTAARVEALIPGVQGRVLGVLSRTSTELTMRTVAQLAGVSAQHASVVTGRLVDLGIGERRDVPPASLLRLAPDNLAAQAVASVANLRSATLKLSNHTAAVGNAVHAGIAAGDGLSAARPGTVWRGERARAAGRLEDAGRRQASGATPSAAAFHEDPGGGHGLGRVCGDVARSAACIDDDTAGGVARR